MTVTASAWWTFGRAGRSGLDQLIPPPSPALMGPYVYDASSARRIPGVARCIQLYGGMVKQMPIDVYRGTTPLPRPRLLSRPDPTRARSWFVENSVVDYLLNGNAIAVVTSRGVDGWPLSVMWLPASWVFVQWNVGVFGAENDVTYYYLGSPLPYDDVIHVRRGADRYYPVRGIGVVEEFLGTLDRIAMEEVYEAQTLMGSAVPSVAIITPQATLTQDVADQAKDSWNAKFAGPTREPAILPAGTVVQPLAWSPSDTQLIEARKLSLIDIGNMFNIDSYWLGAPVAGMTYRTAGPQYQQILRTSIEPVLADFEDVWSDAWLARGQFIRFDRNQLLRDDLNTTATALATLVGAGILSAPQAAQYLGMGAIAGDTSQPLALQQTGGPDTGTDAEIEGNPVP